MAFPAAFIDELIQKNPIDDVVGQYVTLRRHGSNLFGLCPFHSEKTPSFSVVPDKGMFYCFGCQKGGGVINFIMEQESLDYPDAVRFLAKRAGMTIPEDEGRTSTYRRQERLWQLNREAARYFHDALSRPDAEPVQAYMERRGLSRGTVTRFGLGFAPEGWSNLIDAMAKLGYEKQDLLDAGLAVKAEKGSIYDRFRNRLMFPIIDLRGNVIGFGGRVMDDSTPKYLNSPDTIVFNKRKNLFALNIAKKSKQGFLILTEGYMDAIALHQYGFDCAVASLGTSLTSEHATLMAKYTDKVVLTYDADAAGQNATQRAIEILEKAGLQVKVLRVEGAKDPDEFLRKYGADRFRLLLERSENHVEYQLQRLLTQYDLSLDEGKVEYVKAAAELIATRNSSVEREVFAGRIAETAGISTDVVKSEINRAFQRLKAQKKKQQERIDLQPATEIQPRSRSIRYSNIRSAAAEEQLLRILVAEPGLFSKTSGLTGGMFSSPLLGRAFDHLNRAHLEGQTPSLSSMGEEFSPEEASHLSYVISKDIGPVKEKELTDCLSVIRGEYEKQQSQSVPDLLAVRARYQRTKGMGDNQ